MDDIVLMSGVQRAGQTLDQQEMEALALALTWSHLHKRFAIDPAQKL